MNEPQWIGIIVKPINYSLKGAVLHIDPGPGLMIEKAHGIEIEKHGSGSQIGDVSASSQEEICSPVAAEVKKLTLEDGSIELPEWTSNITSVLWVPLKAISDELPKGAPVG